MSLRRFLNVAYAILIEEYQRIGTGLMEAIEKLEELGRPVTADGAPARPTPKSVAASNQASMSMLQGMLANVDRKTR